MKIFAISGLCILTTILLLLLLVRNKLEIPYEFEVVPSDSALTIYCTTNWRTRPVTVSVYDKRVRIYKAVMNPGSDCVSVLKLKNDVDYTVVLSRQDIVGWIRYTAKKLVAAPTTKVDKYIVLVGASVGKSWNLTNAWKRMGGKVFFGFRCEYSFDKSKVLESVISADVKPTAVLIKECAAYFPRDTVESVHAVEYWIEQLKSNGVAPLIATVVPVTRAHDVEAGNGRMKSINDFNEALRTMGARLGVPMLDLQGLVNDGSDEKYLSKKYAISDGLHLSEVAYRTVLDEALATFAHDNVK